MVNINPQSELELMEVRSSVHCFSCEKLYSTSYAEKYGFWGDEPEDYICPKCLEQGLDDFYCSGCSKAIQIYTSVVNQNHGWKTGELLCKDCEPKIIINNIQLVYLGPSLREIDFPKEEI